jgi:hypothetical protein
MNKLPDNNTDRDGWVTINLPPSMSEELSLLADEAGVSPEEVIRRGASAEKLLRRELKAGNKILIRLKGHSMPTRVVVFQ